METSLSISQVQNVSQQLNLAPQLLQWLKLLQVPTVELAQIVQHELETNPVLEMDISRSSDKSASTADDIDSRADNNSSDEPISATFDDNDLAKRVEVLRDIDDEWKDGSSSMEWLASAPGSEDQDRHQYIMDSIVAPTSLHEHLDRQLAVAPMTEAQRKLARLIIGSLDRRGYLDLSLKEIAELEGTSVSQVEAMLEVIHQMDPPGIAARDLRECLLIQINRDKDPVVFAIVHDCFDMLSKRETVAIAAELKINEDSIFDAFKRIGRLNPAPGLDVERERVEYVTPDVVVLKKDGQYVVELNDECVPNLRIMDDYREMLSGKTNLPTTDVSYLRRKMRSATFLIQGIAQRQETLYKVASEIVRVQQDSFDKEDGEIGSLTMGRVARVVGVHETTVSRAIAGKYMKTPKGIVALRSFFEAGYSCSDGSAFTPNQVKRTIAEIVANEEQGKCITDIEISEALAKKGLKVARRTIAKYREEMSLPSSKEREVLKARRRRLAAEPATEPELIAVSAVAV